MAFIALVKVGETLKSSPHPPALPAIIGRGAKQKPNTRKLTTNTAAFLAFDVHKVWPTLTEAAFSPECASVLGIYTFFHRHFFSLSFCQKRKKKVAQVILYKMKRKHYF